MQLNPQRLMAMAEEWDPGPFLEAIELASAQPVQGFPEEPMGMSYAQMLGEAPGQGAVPQGGNLAPGAQPGGAPLPPALMQQIMGSMQQQGSGPPQAPAVAPSKPAMINFQSMSVPRGLTPPPQSFDQLIQGAQAGGVRRR